MPGFEWFGDEERKEVGDVLNTGVLFRYGFDQARKGHWKARTFEEKLGRRLQGAGESGVYCHLCASGTAAVSVALAACGVGAGDEVILPPFTFVASMEALLAAGVIPVFAEIDETLCLNPDAVQKAITRRTKAVMPVHMCGSMARIDRLKEVCDQHGLLLIEDACQALGATFNGKAAGTFGDMGCFSFDPVKTITCGEGGAVVTEKKDLYIRADAYADHGHDHIGDDRGLENHLSIGMNFRISELNAAVGVAQLGKLDAILQKQRANKKALKGALKDIDGVAFRHIPDEEGDSATFLSFFLPDRAMTQKAVAALAQAGVDGCFDWYGNKWHYIRNWGHLKELRSPAPLMIHRMEDRPDYSRVSLPESDRIMERLISMQIKLSWTEEELERRMENMRKALRGVLRG
ncbi:8-amino-3,8-dideoxy-alpha-D-manno-octulosonate transaminase [Candidatus Desulfarcum epimagneticum]|uniref:8-amino-3,8-dideoxy-alpha-D-manno-octulosonate transaminase n=1 Tax=uncultured Desulfobacteraceae bacterium TaxID=218296 RepID=A0A484HMY9_9BACT|nr:8-amino-3,8-dideoxy-alpha-D-manno-octulosonate transaminase [uncultured Desulfobacteraceae bacterium]